MEKTTIVVKMTPHKCNKDTKMEFHIHDGNGEIVVAFLVVEENKKFSTHNETNVFNEFLNISKINPNKGIETKAYSLT